MDAHDLHTSIHRGNLAIKIHFFYLGKDMISSALTH